MTYRRWSQHPYFGEVMPPKGSPEASGGPMFFFVRDRNNHFLDPFGRRINWRIKHPNDINWENELFIVQQTLQSLTPQQIQLATYWGTMEMTKRLSPLVYHLTEKYRLDSPQTARVLAYFYAALNDTFVITWYFKYLWDVARPNQYGLSLPYVLLTPRFPAYPSAHASLAGCAEVVLSYYFPQESAVIKRIMEASAQSRLYAGVHFKVDNDEGLRLGRQIGEMIVNLLKAQNIPR
ncbi:vanadium-dependent haloperoxidase [Desertibacillus haloalkaliphilus]|uniref:vanadium-dependent haloperoxidase n=1 Tax=Desertibacillus haloalkaliphilus TaxID=1328930 RepID=UPI001C26F3BB|nr:vanadium-dependent haloperoxidase [Desertibacillus haloalkaliphilus]MBU8907498.1 vanadium-dependent haloperoxidase [Desertibacillus haloalkaliphilus]